MDSKIYVYMKQIKLVFNQINGRTKYINLFICTDSLIQQF